MRGAKTPSCAAWGSRTSSPASTGTWESTRSACRSRTSQAGLSRFSRTANRSLSLSAALNRRRDACLDDTENPVLREAEPRAQCVPRAWERDRSVPVEARSHGHAAAAAEGATRELDAGRHLAAFELVAVEFAGHPADRFWRKLPAQSRRRHLAFDQPLENRVQDRVRGERVLIELVRRELGAGGFRQ